MTALDTASAKDHERRMRVARARESSVAALNGESATQRAKKCEARADDWARWLRQKMDDSGCDNPAELLPDILARVDQIIDDRVAAATRAIKANLRKALR
jgi:hypothetical protein